MSFVDVSPSTEIALNVECEFISSASFISSFGTFASVQTKHNIVAKFGFIIPAPLATAPILNEVPSSSLTSYKQVLGYASVVMIAFDKFSPFLLFKLKLLVPIINFSKGSLFPITPVLLIIGLIKSKFTFEKRSSISANPFSPVMAFAFLELISTKFV
ncbi:MAG: Uncharacterised protein [Arcobacter lacus]|nr:MAG: Uncharacterised protein [Arcobacter lacus]